MEIPELTYEVLERLSDSLKQAGFEFPDDFGKDNLAKLAETVFYALVDEDD